MQEERHKDEKWYDVGKGIQRQIVWITSVKEGVMENDTKTLGPKEPWAP